jgi:flagellar hook-basal body complex protein FliE
MTSPNTLGGDIAKAVNAYANAAKMKPEAGESPHLPGEGADALKPEFSDLVREGLQRGKAAGYVGEQQSTLALANATELHELVTAVANAELTLQTVVAVRDRVISAYQDIIKMPI